MPAPLAVYIASRVCRALDFAHKFVAPTDSGSTSSIAT